MKRYLLFAFPDYYPSGGMSDFQSDYSRLDAAKAKGLKLLKPPKRFDNFQIYDTRKRMVVDTNEKRF